MEPWKLILAAVSDESILLDLKHLLIEAKQNVPPFLAELEADSEKYLDIGGEKHLLFSYRTTNLFERLLQIVVEAELIKYK